MMTAEERLLKVIFPGTKPKVVYDNKMLMVYDKNETVVGCFFSVEELASFLKVKPQKISQTLYQKNKLYAQYTIKWVKIKRGKDKKIKDIKEVV